MNNENILINENITVRSNLLSYAGFAGALLGESRDVGNQTKNIVFEDLIFENTLMGIVFQPGLASDTLATFELIIKGNIRFYSWIDISLLNSLVLTIDVLTINLNIFDFDTMQDESENDFILLAIVTIEVKVPILGDHYLPRVLLEGVTESENPHNDLVFSKKESFATFTHTGASIETTMSVYNPSAVSPSFITPEAQNGHFLNPNHDLITNQVIQGENL